MRGDPIVNVIRKLMHHTLDVPGCDCADLTSGCKFQENGVKQCLCRHGFKDQRGKCKEQYVPEESRQSTESVGFGIAPYSRHEYEFDSEFLESILDDAVFSLEFKMLGWTGIMFFVKGKQSPTNYMKLLIYDNEVRFEFDCGDGRAFMKSKKSYNDGEWHHVVFSRHGREGRLVIDDTEEISGSSPGQAHRMKVQNPFYVGGLPEQMNTRLESFSGCIRNVEGQGMLWTSEHVKRGVAGTCINTWTKSNFFYSSDGFLVLHCKCGDYSTGCRFKEDGSKECLCSQGYVDRRGLCEASSMDKTTEAGQCVLPDSSSDPSEGTRFGITPNSRLEYAIDEGYLKSIRRETVISLDFKTTGNSGVLFFVHSDSIDFYSRHYLGLFMKQGQMVFKFKDNRDAMILDSMDTYNDGVWHSVVFWRHSAKGPCLFLDGMEVVQGRTYSTNNFSVQAPFYVGGLSEEAAKRYAEHLENITTSFPGCIRNLIVQYVRLTPGYLGGAWNTTSCSRTGTFFPAGGGHLIIVDKFRVGQRMSFSMDIHPWSLSGVLLAVHGRQDYLILQLVNGSIEFTVNNGYGPITATYTPTGNHLCDGEFHTVRATSRSNNSVTLSVDGVVSEMGRRVFLGSSTDTFDPLYVGGLPSSSLSKKGVKTKDHFVGCIRNLELNGEPQSMELVKPFGNITHNCPTT